MTALNYTPLRHKMLAKVAAGEVCRGLGVSGWGIRDDIPSQYGRCESAVSDLTHADYARITGTRLEPLTMTAAGTLVLATWNGKHGEPTP
jgi:hypothetical protein